MNASVVQWIEQWTSKPCVAGSIPARGTIWYHRSMFCNDCGTRLVNGDCNNCFKNSNALRDFEDEND
jgi:hypothetical protein